MAASVVVLQSVPVTPPDYHRIISPRLSIPKDTSLPIPVGLLACQRDPLLRELSTTVVSAVEQQIADEPAAKNKTKKVVLRADKLFEVILHDTVLFPEGGGQPSDIGIIRLQDGEDFEVTQVLRRGGHAIHFVKAKDGEIIGLETGAQITVVLGDAGLMRRLDHMCMHTSQHLLSALLETHLELPTLSWALTAYPTPSYVELPRALTLEEIARIQTIAHTLAYEGRKIYVEVEPLDEENRPGLATVASGRTVGKALPADYTGGVKRTVIIEGVDRNPCCGTHLPSLNNLQLFLLPQTESLARGSMSTARLFFLCGSRLHAHLSTSHSLLTEAAGTLSCGTSLVPARIAQVVEERRRTEKRGEELSIELARLIADNLFAEMRGSASGPSEGGGTEDQSLYTKHYHRSDDPASALAFLQAVASAFTNLASASEFGQARSHLFVLSSSPQTQLNTSTTTLLVFSPDEKKVKFIGDALKADLNVKGGGRGVRWSGKWTGVWKDSKENAVIEEILKKSQNA